MHFTSNQTNISSFIRLLLLFIYTYCLSNSSVHCFATCPSAQLIHTLVRNASEVSCECSQIQEGGWEITCYTGHQDNDHQDTHLTPDHLLDDEFRIVPYAFFIRYETTRLVKITCDNGVPFFRPALFQGFGIETIDSFSFEGCPLPETLPLSVVLHRTSSVASIHAKTYRISSSVPSVVTKSDETSSQTPEISRVRSLSVTLKAPVSLKQFSDAFVGLEPLEQLKLDQFLINDLGTHSVPTLRSDISNSSQSSNSSKQIVESNKHFENIFRFADNFPNLKFLRLKSFTKDSVPGVLFDMLNGLKKLEYLELVSNNLHTLPRNTFAYAGNTLNKLYLYQNDINKIDLNAFANLSHLEILDLSNNQIAELSPNLLKDLKSLVYFSIKGNAMPKLPENLFKHNTKLSFVDLSSNKNLYTLPVNLLQGLDRLTNFSISDCQLTQLSKSPQTFFRNALYLESIQVRGNLITNLTINGLFSGNPKLLKIDFSYNNISDISRDIFSSNSSQILELNFYGNEIQVLPENLFSQLRNVKKLNFGFNRLYETNPHLFLPLQNLEELNLAKNKIISINSEQNRLPFGLGPKLRKVNLSYNELTNFESDFNSINWSLYLNIAELDLRHNKFVGRFRVPVFSSSIAPIVNLDLSHNQFTSVDIQDVGNYDKISTDYHNSDDLTNGETRATRDSNLIKTNIWETHIRLDNNPINCDCFLEPFLNYVKTSQSTSYSSRSSETTYRKSLFLIDSEELMCDKPMHLKGEPLVRLELSQLICVVDDQNICPSDCDCIYQSSDTTVVIDCDGRGLQSLPQELVLSRYYNISLDNSFRVDDISGIVVNLRHNHIKDIANINQMFIWGNKAIKKPEFIDIYLDNNTISTIDEDIIPQYYAFKNASLPLIRVLSLRDNQITSVPLTVLNNFDSYASHLNDKNIAEPKLYLGNNLYDCYNEETPPGSVCPIRDFKSWLNSHIERIGDLNAIKCDKTFFNTSSPINEITDDLLCPILHTSQNDKLLLSLTIVCIILAISLFVVSVLYYRNKQTILAFIYIHFNPIFICLSFSEDDLDSDKVYDAFVSYSSADRDVVMSLIEKLEKPNNDANLILQNTTGASIHEGLSDQIIPENEFKKSQTNISLNRLSGDPNADSSPENSETYFKLCIHERDWLPGNLISWNIVNSVQNSKRTILVLSKDFIESIWFQVEFHTAYYQMLEDKIDRLIVVVKGQLPPKEQMDKDLAFLLTTKTYLVWGEKWFWEKLRYALPHKKLNNQFKDHSLDHKSPIKSNGANKHYSNKNTINNKSSEAMKEIADKKIANHFNLNSYSNPTQNTTNGKIAQKSGPKSLRNSSSVLTQSNPRFQPKSGFENKSFVTETNT